MVVEILLFQGPIRAASGTKQDQMSPRERKRPSEIKQDKVSLSVTKGDQARPTETLSDSEDSVPVHSSEYK